MDVSKRFWQANLLKPDSLTCKQDNYRIKFSKLLNHYINQIT